MRYEVFTSLFSKKRRERIECLWRIVEWRIVDRRCGSFEKIEVFFWQYERDIKKHKIVITSNNKK